MNHSASAWQIFRKICLFTAFFASLGTLTTSALGFFIAPASSAMALNDTLHYVFIAAGLLLAFTACPRRLIGVIKKFCVTSYRLGSKIPYAGIVIGPLLGIIGLLTGIWHIFLMPGIFALICYIRDIVTKRKQNV